MNDVRAEALVMVKFHSAKPVVMFAGLKTKPESKPPDNGSQGWAKDDWVTEWLPGLGGSMELKKEIRGHGRINSRSNPLEVDDITDRDVD